MKIIENQLIRQIQGGVMKSKLTPHLIGPLYTFMFTMLLELFGRTAPWVTPSLALCFVGLSIGAVFAGLRSALVSATIIVFYGLIEYQFDIYRMSQVALAAYGCAFVYGKSRRLLIKWYQEAEYYRLKAIDNYNGNRAKMVEALDRLDEAVQYAEAELKRDPENETLQVLLKTVITARKRLADTLTLTGSWHEIAKDKQMAVQEIEKVGGFSYRTYEQIGETNLLVREVLRDVHYIRRTLEQAATKTQELKND